MLSEYIVQPTTCSHVLLRDLGDVGGVEIDLSLFLIRHCLSVDIIGLLVSSVMIAPWLHLASSVGIEVGMPAVDGLCCLLHIHIL